MTIKEKLYMEYVITKNKLNALRGEKLIGGDNIEEYFNSYDFSNRASHHTKDEIRNMIDYAKRCYESEVEKMRIEIYFNTEEGKAEKERLTKEYEALQNERIEMFRNANKELGIFIKDFSARNGVSVMEHILRRLVLLKMSTMVLSISFLGIVSPSIMTLCLIKDLK